MVTSRSPHSVPITNVMNDRRIVTDYDHQPAPRSDGANAIIILLLLMILAAQVVSVVVMVRGFRLDPL